MKNFTKVIVTVLLIWHYNAFSQWTTDPANPLVVGAAVNVQSNVQSFPDGNGGLFTFWRDSRSVSGKFDIYGQHYNSEGIAQWTANGKVIIDGQGNITSFHIIRTETGNIFIAWLDNVAVNSPDNGIFAQKLNTYGEPIWASNLTMKTGNSFIRVTLVESAGNYYSCMQALVTGGADKIYMNKFTENGSLLWPINEYNITYTTNDIGRVSATADHLGGLYVYYSSANALGALVYCNHMDSTGNQWPNWINVTAGSAGLDGLFSAIGDAEGVTFCWVGGAVPNTTGQNIYSRRLILANGSLAWSGGTRSITEAMGNQTRFYWKKSGNDYYMVWSDSRPGVVGNSAIYGQKFNITGEMLWTQDGVAVANLNTYIPYPEFDLDADNTMVVGHRATSGNFVAHKVLSDGTVQWGPQGVVTFTTAYAPFYEDVNMVFTGDKFLAIGARVNPGGGADGIYMSQIESSALGIVDANEHSKFGFYPNPTKDFIYFKGITEPNTIKIFDVTGKMLMDSGVDGSSNSLDIGKLTNGLYIMTINNLFTRKIVKQ